MAAAYTSDGRYLACTSEDWNNTPEDGPPLGPSADRHGGGRQRVKHANAGSMGVAVRTRTYTHGMRPVLLSSPVAITSAAGENPESQRRPGSNPCCRWPWRAAGVVPLSSSPWSSSCPAPVPVCARLRTHCRFPRKSPGCEKPNVDPVRLQSLLVLVVAIIVACHAHETRRYLFDRRWRPSELRISKPRDAMVSYMRAVYPPRMNLPRLEQDSAARRSAVL
jgi:hypothetical protein